MEAWRRVEVAACEELPGPARRRTAPARRSSRRSARRASPSRQVHERERVTDHDVAAFVDVLAASAGAAGRWIHFGLTSSDVLDTALALQLRAAGEVDRGGRPHARAARSPRARASTRARSASGAPTACTPSRRRSGSSSRASRSRPHRNAVRLERAFAQVAVGAISGAVGTYAATSPEFEARVLARLGLAARGRLHAGRPARPPRRAARRDRARRRRARALRHRDPPPAAHRGARGPGAVPRRPEGLLGDAAQAQPDQERADRGPRARAARQRPGRARERRALARARHLPLLGRARDPARLHDPARLPAAPRDRARRRT